MRPTVVLVLATTLLPSVRSTPAVRAQDSGVLGDFNGDGFDDLAVAAPPDSVGTRAGAGVVTILAGSANGLTTGSGDQNWHQDRAGVDGASEAGDHFGAALAVGDFNGDRFSDLAIGVPEEDVGTKEDAGAVNVLYGSGGGLTTAGDQIWDQDSSGVEGAAEAYDHLGDALAAGDFDRDGFFDLAIGEPGEAIGDVFSAGMVNVLRGSAAGLTAARDQVWHQDVNSVEDTVEEDDWFGSELTAGDFNGDGIADLAVGVVNENIRTENDGAVNVLYGSAVGLSAGGDQLWTLPRLGSSSGVNDHFGAALAAGDFNGDRFRDLAVGATKAVSGQFFAGAVYVIYSGNSGLGLGWHTLTQDSPGVPGAARESNIFGGALAAGDFDRDGRSDLAIGISGQDIGSVSGAGAALVLFGAAGGVATSRQQLWTQDSAYVEDRAEQYDFFGSHLAVGDFTGDGFEDLAVGVKDEDLEPLADAGVVNVVFGSGGGLTAIRDQLWSQDSPGAYGEEAEPRDNYGSRICSTSC